MFHGMDRNILFIVEHVARSVGRHFCDRIHVRLEKKHDTDLVIHLLVCSVSFMTVMWKKSLAGEGAGNFS